MATKNKARQPLRPQTEDPTALEFEQEETETLADAVAHTSLRPTVQAALTLMDYNKAFGEIAVNTLVADLGKQCELASNGDLLRAEALLMAQAHTLDAIFHTLARRASNCERLNLFDVNLRLALKAQSQCRATLETLAEIKNPMAGAYVRQANIAAGHQQVNNGLPPAGEASRARETENPPNKLLEVTHGERLDFGATGTTSTFNSPVEAVGAIHRPKDSKR
ncbi:MAG: hypothetical protein HY942_02320 [Gammaproteobacteria bacterium]|nr:hypothetical protein [Gammaproteobacteria bacterium]